MTDDELRVKLAGLRVLAEQRGLPEAALMVDILDGLADRVIGAPDATLDALEDLRHPPGR